MGVRTQMTQRGKILIVSLDDKTAVVEVTVYSEVFEANKNIFKEDEFLLVVGKVSEDRFNGGLRITAEKVFDLATSRIQYGHKLEMTLSCDVAPAKIAEVLQPYRNPNGLPVSMRIKPQGVECTLQLGDEWRVAPSDALKQALELTLGAKEVAVEY
jgi:DNA polymerase-3 subunit alpha